MLPVLLLTRVPGDNLYAWSQVLTSQYMPCSNMHWVGSWKTYSRQELRALLILVHSLPSDQIRHQGLPRSSVLKYHC